MASPPLVVDASPKGSSFGRRSGLRRAIHLNSPTDGSINRLETVSPFYVGETGKATFNNVSRHMNSRVAIVDNEVLCQTVRLAGYLDIVTCWAKLSNQLHDAMPLVLPTILLSSNRRAPKAGSNVGSFTSILKLRAVVIDGRDITALTAHGKRQRIGGASINDIRVIIGGYSKCCGCNSSQKRQQESTIRGGQHGS